MTASFIIDRYSRLNVVHRNQVHLKKVRAKIIFLDVNFIKSLTTFFKFGSKNTFVLECSLRCLLLTVMEDEFDEFINAQEAKNRKYGTTMGINVVIYYRKQGRSMDLVGKR